MPPKPRRKPTPKTRIRLLKFDTAIAVGNNRSNMQTSYFKDKEIPEISVYLEHIDADLKEPKKFLCISCGNTVFTYWNNVRMIVPGAPGFAKSPIAVHCTGKIKVPGVHNDDPAYHVKCRARYYVS